MWQQARQMKGWTTGITVCGIPVQCSAVQRSAVQCSAVQCSTVQLNLTVGVCTQGNNRIHTQIFPGSSNTMDGVTFLYCKVMQLCMSPFKPCIVVYCSVVYCKAVQGHCMKLLVSPKREIDSPPWIWHHLTVALDRLWARKVLYSLHLGNW